jgi:hypothetical protein
MRYDVTVEPQGAEWVARAAVPACEGRGPTRAEAIERLRAAIRFDLEICPCDVTADSGIELDVRDVRGASGAHGTGVRRES